jgi:hypothetical protein
MKAYGGVHVYINIFLTSALLEVSGQLHAPSALSPGKIPRYPLGGPESRLNDRRSENSWLHRYSNSDPSVVQPIASRYTDYATF